MPFIHLHHSEIRQEPQKIRFPPPPPPPPPPKLSFCFARTSLHLSKGSPSSFSSPFFFSFFLLLLRLIITIFISFFYLSFFLSSSSSSFSSTLSSSTSLLELSSFSLHLKHENHYFFPFISLMPPSLFFFYSFFYNCIIFTDVMDSKKQCFYRSIWDQEALHHRIKTPDRLIHGVMCCFRSPYAQNWTLVPRGFGYDLSRPYWSWIWARLIGIPPQNIP